MDIPAKINEYPIVKFENGVIVRTNQKQAEHGLQIRMVFQDGKVGLLRVADSFTYNSENFSISSKIRDILNLKDTKFEIILDEYSCKIEVFVLKHEQEKVFFESYSISFLSSPQCKMIEP